MGKLIVYGIEASPPVRSVLLTLKALGLDYELRTVNVVAGEQMQDEFLKKNPQHTVPLLDDNGHVIWDSHAIAAYLVRKYGKNDSLYPKDYYQRAVVDQRLHFDTGVLFPSLRNITYAVVFKNETVIPQEKLENIEKAYEFLEAFLEHDFVAGDHLTIADLCILTTLTSVEIFLPLDPNKMPRIATWLKRMAKLPYHASGQSKGLAEFHELIRSKLGQN